MPRTRITATDLARVLNASPQPIYALDDRRAVVFCNRALLEWIGLAAEDLLGRRCAYHSSPEATGADAAAAGLCPPPGAMAAGETIGTVVSLGPEGELRRRRARFLSLATDPAEPVGVWAVVEAADLPESETAPLQQAHPSEAAALHEEVRLFRHRTAARFHTDRLVGRSLAAGRVRAQVEAAATSRASVLLVGPKGSGRQHVAHAIHYGTHAAARGPIVPLACALLDGELIQSTIAALAGRREPGAVEQRTTLLMNDVDRLPADVQGPLADVFSARSPTMRVIGTSAASLLDLAEQGAYRKDLASLLSTLVIELPPLAQRREDIPALAQVFVEEINARGGKQVRGFAPEALDRLVAHRWTGNLDEMAAVVEEAHQRTEGAEIGLAELPKSLHLAAEAAARPRRTETTIDLDDFLARVERELIERAMQQARGNKAKAARLLGMTRPRLYRRLVQLGLEPSAAGPAPCPPPERPLT